jgi:hypothetical protein
MLCGLLGLASPTAVRAQGASSSLDQFLQRMGIDARQRAIAARGRAVTKLLPAKDNRDVTVVGLIGVDVPRDTIIARAADIGRSLAARGNRFRVFGNPPSAADVRDVAFDEDEYRGLRNCKSGDCDFKLPAADMAGFVQQVDWSSRGAKAQADERLRAMMLRLATDYVAHGNAAMPVYEDQRGLKSGDAFDTMLEQITELYPDAPELKRYLTTYPAGRPDGARDFVYWSEERLPHLRPVLTLDHVVVYKPARADAAAVVARKQIYANHYFEGALELLAIVDGDGGAEEPAAYMLTLRRFRFDNLPGGLLNIRGRVRRGLADAARVDLERQRALMQSAASP